MSISAVISRTRFSLNSESMTANDPMQRKPSVITVIAVSVCRGVSSYPPNIPTATSYLKVLIINARHASLGSLNKPDITGLNMLAIAVIVPM